MAIHVIASVKTSTSPRKTELRHPSEHIAKLNKTRLLK